MKERRDEDRRHNEIISYTGYPADLGYGAAPTLAQDAPGIVGWEDARIAETLSESILGVPGVGGIARCETRKPL
jgi:hypothetical protein